MPIYTYRCENCGIQFERRQKFADDPLSICPECEKETLRKVYLPVGIVFKGSGFYSTDNRSSSKVLTSSKSGDGETAAAPSKEKDESAKKEKSKADDK